jgi:hypothetical protein
VLQVERPEWDLLLDPHSMSTERAFGICTTIGLAVQGVSRHEIDARNRLARADRVGYAANARTWQKRHDPENENAPKGAFRDRR